MSTPTYDYLAELPGDPNADTSYSSGEDQESQPSQEGYSDGSYGQEDPAQYQQAGYSDGLTETQPETYSGGDASETLSGVDAPETYSGVDTTESDTSEDSYSDLNDIPYGY